MKGRPSRRSRIIIATAAALWGAAWFAVEIPRYAVDHTDFAQAWFGARAILSGDNPYELVGPGRAFDMKWPLLYPGTALVAALPFAWLPEIPASLLFVTLSSFLLGYALTRDGWHLLPLLASEAFFASARLAQWSMLFTAALFLPWLAFLAVVKPQSGVPVLAAGSRPGLRTAAIGGVALLVLSLMLLPSWPRDWLALVRTADHLRPPLFHLGGFVILLVLLRWRRREAWLVLALACMPQTWGWYNLLMLFTVAATFRQAAALVAISTVAYIAGPYFVGNLGTREGFESSVGALQIATAYLPATIVVLRRPNVYDGEGALSGWVHQRLSRSG